MRFISVSGDPDSYHLSSGKVLPSVSNSAAEFFGVWSVSCSTAASEREASSVAKRVGHNFKQPPNYYRSAISAKGMRVGTGVAGLDNVLRADRPWHRLYVVEGDPGAGKTTLSLQFLLEGVRRGERVLYVTLSETAEELDEVAESHGWSIDGVNLLELDALAERLQEETEYTVYHPLTWNWEKQQNYARGGGAVAAPTRVALDSVSELRILSQTSARYRREILGLKQFFTGKQCTVLVLDDRTTVDGEQQLQSIAHGVIRMNRETRDYGDTRRQTYTW